MCYRMSACYPSHSAKASGDEKPGNESGPSALRLARTSQSVLILRRIEQEQLAPRRAMAPRREPG